MSEVRYSINGHYFKDFGVFVSDSNGIADTLKRKKVNSYDWAEYHGISVDLSKPKFEAREIELKCFIVGDNWETLFANFNKMVRDEFAKEGTQRLLIEPFGFKALPYEVFLQDEVKVDKTFSNGQMVATFSIKMIEPNPIKKVLYFTGNTLDLAFNCPTETEIFYGNGLKEVANGNVSLSGKTLANRVVSGYGFEGRNLIAQSYLPTVFNSSDNSQLFIEIVSLKNEPCVFVSRPKGEELYYWGYGFEGKLTIGQTYTASVYVHQRSLATKNIKLEVYRHGSITIAVDSHEWRKISYTFTYSGGWAFILIGIDHNDMEIKELKVERGNKATDWTPAPEDEKYIILAGNVEDITGLTTNAKVLWDKL